MKCAHCLVEFHASKTIHYLGKDKECHWAIVQYECPNPKCQKMIFSLVGGDWVQTGIGPQCKNAMISYLVRPKAVSRSPIPPEVPEKYAEDYREACTVLADSPKASTALSRRALQLILRDISKVKPGDLYQEIQEVIGRNILPTHISECLDAVRTIGNFGAHPIKSKNTGEIVAVETGEADWNLDVLESLFDYYFVQPEIIKQKKAALNKKLQDAGKQLLK